MPESHSPQPQISGCDGKQTNRRQAADLTYETMAAEGLTSRAQALKIFIGNQEENT